MAFQIGPYTYLIFPACRAKFRKVLQKLPDDDRNRFIDELDGVRAEIDQGRCPGDLDSLGRDGCFGLRIFGYRVVLQVDQHEKTIIITNVDDD